MRYQRINQPQLVELHETDAYSIGGPKPGGVYTGLFRGMGADGPNVRIDVGSNGGLCTIIESTHPHLSGDSNTIRDKLIFEKRTGFPINVLVLGSYGGALRAVATDLEPGMYRLSEPKLTAEKAHAVVKSDNIFWGQCTSRKVEAYGDANFWKSPAAITYDSKKNLMRGYIEPVDLRFPSGSADTWCLPFVEDSCLSQTEQSLTSALIDGSREYGFVQLLPGDNMLLRVKGNNGRGTNFYEPVINLEKSDDAFDNTGRKMVTKVLSPDGFERMVGFRSGDIVLDLPILHPYQDAGVGYIFDCGVLFSQGGSFKPVVVEGGDLAVTKVIKKSQIVQTGDFLLAQRISADF
ncbi:hypothetical protein K9M79_04755 [Candidatus Woesearchaeota archaeon]|nr:hypothetical protein [Candidatus Woesearchaeota archaeon]